MHVFDTPGRENTAEVLRLVCARLNTVPVECCLVASNTGETAWQAHQMLSGITVVAITHCTGFREPNKQEMLPAMREKLLNAGVAVHTATHAFGTLGRAVRDSFGTYQVDEIMAHTLRIFGQGTKVAVEIALMAADAGLAPVGRPVVSIGGTKSGADTALILLPANTHRFFDLRVQEIICKPALTS